MKQELMRPELDATQFVQFNYWDTGHQGCFPAMRSIWILNGWRWPITTTTSASWN